MSCSNATGPLNITATKETCLNKCAYSFNYGISSCSLKNKGEYLSIKYDANSYVVFNGENYTTQEIRIYQPSLHAYDGKRAAAELIVIHTSLVGGNLLVCVPIQAMDASSASSALFDQIVPQIPPNAGESATVNVKDFTLNSFIPVGAFYSYTATLPYPPCNGRYNYVVFNTKTTIANMTSKTLNKFRDVIASNTISVATEGSVLYYNEKGVVPPQGAPGSDIYIDCNPVGEGPDESVPVDLGQESSDAQKKWDEILESPVLPTVLGGLLILVLIVAVGRPIISWLKDNVSIPSLPERRTRSSPAAPAAYDLHERL